jgi:hypothetical protein
MIAVAEPMLDLDGEIVECSCLGTLVAGQGVRTIVPELPPYPWGLCSLCGREWIVIQDQPGEEVMLVEVPSGWSGS